MVSVHGKIIKSDVYLLSLRGIGSVNQEDMATS